MDIFFGQRGPYKQVNYNQISKQQASIQSGCDIFFKQYIKKILDESDLSARFMRRESVKPVEILKELIYLDPHFKENKIRLVNLTSDKILVDINQLKFVFRKVIENAVFYSDGNVEATVQIEKAEDEILISCQDEGIGICQYEKTKVFQPFFRGVDSSKFARGVGLGLTLTKEILNHHDANIRIESSGRGLGASVYISFPIKQLRKVHSSEVSKHEGTPIRLSY